MRKSSDSIKEHYESTRLEYVDRIEYRDAQNRLHRRGGPAIEFKNGSKQWHFEGELQFKYVAA